MASPIPTPTPSPSLSAAPAPVNVFERYLTVWVFLCIVLSIGLGQVLPDLFQAVGRMELTKVNLPVGVMVWVMIIPMLVKVDFGALHGDGVCLEPADRRRPAVHTVAGGGQRQHHGAGVCAAGDRAAGGAHPGEPLQGLVRARCPGGLSAPSG